MPNNMLGTLYAGGSRPAHVAPAGSAAEFDGVHSGLANPSNPGYFSGEAPQTIAVVTAAASSAVPDPDPEETFTNVRYQLFGPEGPGSAPRWPMQGFVVNYAQTGAADAAQIMQCHGSQPGLARYSNNDHVAQPTDRGCCPHHYASAASPNDRMPSDRRPVAGTVLKRTHAALG